MFSVTICNLLAFLRDICFSQNKWNIIMHGRNAHVATDWGEGPLTDCILGVEEDSVDLDRE